MGAWRHAEGTITHIYVIEPTTIFSVWMETDLTVLFVFLVQEKTGPKIGGELLLPRGEEHGKFLNSKWQQRIRLTLLSMYVSELCFYGLVMVFISVVILDWAEMNGLK